MVRLLLTFHGRRLDSVVGGFALLGVELFCSEVVLATIYCAFLAYVAAGLGFGLKIWVLMFCLCSYIGVE